MLLHTSWRTEILALHRRDALDRRDHRNMLGTPQA